ncbi:MAG: ATP-binding protein [Candidatus Accumulibacter sp.]|nr:ATP-binding protein [Candidatus Accumulibacter conexus]
MRQDKIQRDLVVQALGLLGLLALMSWLLLPELDPGVALGVAFGVVVGVALGVLFGVTAGRALGVAAGVVLGVTWGVACAVGWGVWVGMFGGMFGGVVRGAVDPALSWKLGAAWGMALGACLGGFGVALGMTGSLDRGAVGTAGGVAGIAVSAVALGLAVGAALGLLGGAAGSASDVALVVALVVAFGVAVARFDAALLCLVPAWLQRSTEFAIRLQRVSLVPIPGLETSLTERLQTDWLAGLRVCEGLLRYTLQITPVVAAIRASLEGAEEERLLPRIAAWCDLGLHDWQALRYQSASLRSDLVSGFWEGCRLIPRRWRPQIDAALRYDTPAAAACAGFWSLHAGEVGDAERAFAHVRHLPFGSEMHGNAAALSSALRCDSFALIGDWYPPEASVGDCLRPAVTAALGCLGEVARECRLVRDSHSSRERSGALNRAVGALKDLDAMAAGCPQPEQVVVYRILTLWLAQVLGVAREVGTLTAREVVASPYIVGAPLPADRLVGRAGVFDQIRSAWAKAGQRDSLVVYGHRRMGKTSVMKNVVTGCDFGADTGFAYLTLQTVDWSDALADLCRGIAFALWQAAPQALAEPAAATFDAYPLDALRRFLASVNAAGERRFILVLDEYELLDEHLSAEQANRFVMLLRGLTQQHPWLVVALVGLHTLQERSASFYQAIYAWRPVRVSFLDAAGVADVLQLEEDDFPLAYSPEALTRIHRLTGGQPFLVQLVGDGLVQGFNRRLRENLERPSATFADSDVDALVASKALYEQGSVYYRGIWQQAAERPAGQHALLRALAAHPEGLDELTLGQLAGVAGAELADALQALREHDVLIAEAGRCRYAVELMRLWVADERMELDL